MNTFLQRIHHLDTRVFVWLNLTQGCHYQKLVRTLSHTGDGYLYAVIGLCLLYLEPHNGKLFFCSAVTAYLLNVTTYLLVKNTIKRDRPQQKIPNFVASIKPSDQFSFPSGHTAAAFVFTVLVLHFYPVFAISVLLWALLIGLSRVLLGVHFPGDIIAGSIMGSLFGWLGIQITQTLL